MHRALFVVAALATLTLGRSSASAGDPPGEPAGGATRDPDEPPTRDPNASLATIFHGPFSSSRLFSMPTADVIGAYELSVSYDGSMLQQPGVLTSAGVLAIGFGDIAQLEYRHTSAISVTGINAPLPAVGAQFEAPIPEYPYVPHFGIAVRIGVPRDERFGAATVEEKVTDFYFVAREKLAPWLTLHGGVRVSPAKFTLTGDPALGDKLEKSRTLALPTFGLELAVNDRSRFVAEIAAVPQFMWMADGLEAPTISYGMLARLGLRWRVLPSVVFDGSLGYQLANQNVTASDGPRNVVQQFDIRLGAEVFVPWGALACRAVGAFCD